VKKFADHRGCFGGRWPPCLGDLSPPAPRPGSLPGKGADHGADHAAAGPARDDRGDGASGGAVVDGACPLSCSPIIWARYADLHALCGGDPVLGLPVARPSLEEAAYDLGERKLSTFRLIILPLVMPGIISSLLICFTISIDEFIIAELPGGRADAAGLYLRPVALSPSQMPVDHGARDGAGRSLDLLLIIAEYFRRRGIAKTGGKDSGGFL
jgi:hypothetical protein